MSTHRVFAAVFPLLLVSTAALADETAKRPVHRLDDVVIVGRRQVPVASVEVSRAVPEARPAPLVHSLLPQVSAAAARDPF